MIDVLISPFVLGCSFWGIIFGLLASEFRPIDTGPNIFSLIVSFVVRYGLGFGITFGSVWVVSSVAAMIWGPFGEILRSTLEIGLDRSDFQFIASTIFVTASPYLIVLFFWGIWESLRRVPAVLHWTSTDLLELERRVSDFWTGWGAPILRKTIISVFSTAIAFGIAALFGLKDGATVSIVGVTIALTIALA